MASAYKLIWFHRTIGFSVNNAMASISCTWFSYARQQLDKPQPRRCEYVNSLIAANQFIRLSTLNWLPHRNHTCFDYLLIVNHSIRRMGTVSVVPYWTIYYIESLNREYATLYEKESVVRQSNTIFLFLKKNLQDNHLSRKMFLCLNFYSEIVYQKSALCATAQTFICRFARDRKINFDIFFSLFSSIIYWYVCVCAHMPRSLTHKLTQSLARWLPITILIKVYIDCRDGWQSAETWLICRHKSTNWIRQ